MKKVLSGLLVATAVASVAQAAPFEGFYVGAQTGLTSRKTEVRSTSPKANAKKSTINYGIFAGYGHKMDSLYVGAELSLAHTPNKEVTVSGTKIKFERGVAFGLAPRVGFFAAPDILVFAKLGLEAARESVKSTTTDLTSKKTSVSFVPGLGVEKSFGNFIARVSYEHKFGKNIKHKTVATSSYKATEHRFLLGAAWGF
jgi:opacity protein-like surface antigen